jgi:ribosomal protein S18 acetylase RimI-like enzyme
VQTCAAPPYRRRQGSTLDRALLLKFMQRTYRELYAEQDFAHLATTVDQYLGLETPLWWVEPSPADSSSLKPARSAPVACLWLGNVIDQAMGDRHAYIFLLYVCPEQRRQGIGSALMRYAEDWAKQRGDRQIGLQVFQDNHSALNLYKKLGYQVQSLWMAKPL